MGPATSANSWARVRERGAHTDKRGAALSAPAPAAERRSLAAKTSREDMSAAARKGECGVDSGLAYEAKKRRFSQGAQERTTPSFLQPMAAALT